MVFWRCEGAGRESALRVLGNEVWVDLLGAAASFPLPWGDTDGWVRRPSSVIELVVEVGVLRRR